MSARSGRVVWCLGVPPTPFGLWGSVARRRRALDGGPPPLERSREWGRSRQGFSATRRGAVPGRAARAGMVKGPLRVAAMPEPSAPRIRAAVLADDEALGLVDRLTWSPLHAVMPEP